MNKYVFSLFLISLMTLFSVVSYASPSPLTAEDFLSQHAHQARLCREWGGKFLGTTGAIWLGSSLFFEKEATSLQIVGGLYATAGLLTVMNKTSIEKVYENTKTESEETRLDAIRKLQDSEKISRFTLGGLIAIPALFVPNSGKAALGAVALPFFIQNAF